MDEPPHAQYTKGPFLGRGAYKTVYRAIDRSKGIEVAWNEVAVMGGVDFAKLLSEIDLLRSLKGKYFIGCYESWIAENSEHLIFISELMESGNLKSFIHEAKGVSIGVMKDYCGQILKGLIYIHTLDPPIIHRDIKLDNIFFHGPAGRVKIGDLGIATLIDPGKGKKPKTVCGTPEFMAPEFYNENYNEKVDIWAFGLCVLEMVTLEYPYQECDNNLINVYKAVTAGLKPKVLTKIKDDPILDFICICLEKDHHKRPSAEQLFPHSFLVRTPGDTSKFAELRNETDRDAILETIGNTEEGWNKFIAERTDHVRHMYENPSPELKSGVEKRLQKLQILKEKNIAIRLQNETPTNEPTAPAEVTPPTATEEPKPREDVKRPSTPPVLSPTLTPAVFKSSPSKGGGEDVILDGPDDLLPDDLPDPTHPVDLVKSNPGKVVTGTEPLQGSAESHNTNPHPPPSQQSQADLASGLSASGHHPPTTNPQSQEKPIPSNLAASQTIGADQIIDDDIVIEEEDHEIDKRLRKPPTEPQTPNSSSDLKVQHLNRAPSQDRGKERGALLPSSKPTTNPERSEKEPAPTTPDTVRISGQLQRRHSQEHTGPLVRSPAGAPVRDNDPDDIIYDDDPELSTIHTSRGGTPGSGFQPFKPTNKQQPDTPFKHPQPNSHPELNPRLLVIASSDPPPRNTQSKPIAIIPQKTNEIPITPLQMPPDVQQNNTNKTTIELQPNPSPKGEEGSSEDMDFIFQQSILANLKHFASDTGIPARASSPGLPPTTPVKIPSKPNTQQPPAQMLNSPGYNFDGTPTSAPPSYSYWPQTFNNGT